MQGSRSAEERDAVPLAGAVTPVGGGHVSIVDVTKRYAGSVAVDAASLEIGKGELLTILGPSGSGKTTLLRMIAGLVEPSEGEIWLDGARLNDRATYERNIGMVFQSLALFPHLDVFGNIAFPLWMRRTGKAETRRRVQAALDTVRLPQIAGRRIEELSGGQRQRVALARALVYRPSLLLLDEPLASLDQKLREEMQLEIVRLHEELDVTIVNVTHDQKEALTISDRIAVMNGGRIDQIGSSIEVYERPQTPFVATFLGNTNAISGRICDAPGGRALVPENTTSLIDVDTSLPPDSSAVLMLRAEMMALSRKDLASSGGLPGVVTLKAFQGNATQFEVDVPALGQHVRIESFDRADASRFDVGNEVVVSWRPEEAPVLEGGQS
jgi:ABC-type Fe3+/spermidine/putrescine transport system ATPase subunit